MNEPIKPDVYNVNSYTDIELYNILDLINPSDRELEAQIIYYIRKYQQIHSADSKRLEQFFQDIYTHFFIQENENMVSKVDTDSNDNISIIEREGFEGIKLVPSSTTNTNTQIIKKDPLPNNSQTINYTNSLAYVPNNLNPLLKQTIKRMVVVDSQFREWQKSYTTDFTVNFSEVLKDVVSISLTSFQIPYTWYTVNSDYGSNFVYIKGNSPGINNGNHDYKIEIIPGNYTNTEIIKALHDSIETLKLTHTDICFNNTDILYNPQNCKSTFNIGITNIYNFSNYNFSFGKWESPDSKSEERTDNIASFLGFNSASYYANSFYSERSIPENILNGVNNIQIDGSNNTIYVVQYWNDISFDSSSKDYIDNSYNNLKYNTIPIKLEINNKRSVNDIINDVNTKMQINPKFDYVSSTLELIRESSSFRWRIKLNRTNTTNQLNSRIAVYFPNEYNPWVGPSSVFKFKKTNELNNLVSETPLVTESTDISGVFIKLKCNLPGYILPINDISFSYVNSKISLTKFIDDTNTFLFKTVGNTDATNYIRSDYVIKREIKRQINLSNSSFALNAESRLAFTVDIIHTIYGNQFTYVTPPTFLCFDDNTIQVNQTEDWTTLGNGDNEYTKIITGQIAVSENYIIDTKNSHLITIESKLDSLYMSDVSFNLYFNVLTSVTVNGTDGLKTLIDNTLQGYSDSDGSYPLRKSYIIFKPNVNGMIDFSMNITVNKILSESNYLLELGDTSNNRVDLSKWYTAYKFKSQESLYKTDISYNIITLPNSSITSYTTTDPNFQYNLRDISLSFTCITPKFSSGGNNFQIKVPDKIDYSLNEILIALNEKFVSTTFTTGTVITTTVDNHLKIDFQILKTFNNSFFDISSGNFLINVLNNRNAIDYNINKTFSGELPYSSTYAIGTNTTIMLLQSKDIYNTEISDVSYTVPFISSNTNFTNATELFTRINESFQNTDEFKDSNITGTGVFNGTGLTNQLNTNNWYSNYYDDYITKSDTGINFNVTYTNTVNSRDVSIYLSTPVLYDISLSFDVSYNTSGSINSNSVNRQFYIRKRINDNDTLMSINITGNDKTSTGRGQIPIETNDVSGNYRVHMNLLEGETIYFRLTSIDNIEGSTTININNITYTQERYPIYYNWTLTVDFNKRLTAIDYNVSFSDTYFGDDINSFWYTYFKDGLNISNNKITGISESIKYKLTNNVTNNANNAIITGVETVNLGRIDLSTNSTKTSNILWVKPYSAAEGVYDTNGYNDISLNVPAFIYYSTEDLINTINILFDGNTTTSGTRMSIITTDGYSYCQIRWNINKVYKTNDYKLVFYDTSSFLKCFAGNKSYRNSSADSTLGWVLGFHSKNEYYLQDANLGDGYYIDLSTGLATENQYAVSTDTSPIKEISLTGDTIVNVFLYKYLMIIIDDYTQNHLNDGLVTIAQKDTSLVLPSYASRSKYSCDPVTKAITNTGITSGATNNLTQNQLYSINQIINAQNTKLSMISAGPFVKDVFAMIPLDVAGMIPGQVFTDKVTAIQDRVYFGPVNIHKLAIKLINDKGDVLDLNGANWSLQLLCEQLYQTSPTSNSSSNNATE